MERICTQCSTAFEITDGDLTFLEEVSPVFNGKKELVPPPLLCPSCRYRERLTWRNERNMYKRTCDATGKPVVSIFSPDKLWPPVYDQKYWWSDEWNRFSYGKEMDFNRPFFDQWAELFQAMPQLALNNQNSENCEYTNQSQNNKDCYMVFCSGENRDCLYGMWMAHGMNCVDGLYVERSELCYELMSSANCYRCAYSQNLENCSDVFFSRNCIGCKNCFGCINVRNKEYYYFNEQLSKTDYEKLVGNAPLSNYVSSQNALKKFNDFSLNFPRKYYNGSNIEDATGDYLQNDRDVHDTFNCRNSEHVRNCQDSWWAQNCQEMTETANNDFSYSLEGCGQSSNALFSKKFADSSDILYSSHCNFSKNIFGCVGLNHAQYCILNKQYSREEYNTLVPRIIGHMRSTGEWGSHFPHRFSPYGYNETVAQEYFPLTQEEATATGYNWKIPDADIPHTIKCIPAAQLPDTIADVSDDILNWAIVCETTGRPFKIIKQELDFYRRMNIPIPRCHHDERHRNRMKKRNPRKLWNRSCMKCGTSIQTTYPPDHSEMIYCERCYLEAVY